LGEFFEEECDGAFLFVDLGLWGEGAQFWVGGELLDLFFGVFFALLLFGEVQAGDLEAVEEQAGAAGVEVVGGYAL
jgi:hypothetical protein